MITATDRLIAKCLALSPTGTIGDGMVAELRDLARRARDELPQKERDVRWGPGSNVGRG